MQEIPLDLAREQYMFRTQSFLAGGEDYQREIPLAHIKYQQLRIYTSNTKTIQNTTNYLST